MKSHDLAKFLLKHPNLDVMIEDLSGIMGPLEVREAFMGSITEDDSELWVTCKGKEGQEIMFLGYNPYDLN